MVLIESAYRSIIIRRSKRFFSAAVDRVSSIFSHNKYGVELYKCKIEENKWFKIKYFKFLYTRSCRIQYRKYQKILEDTWISKEIYSNTWK